MKRAFFIQRTTKLYFGFIWIASAYHKGVSITKSHFQLENFNHEVMKLGKIYDKTIYRRRKFIHKTEQGKPQHNEHT